MRKIFKDILSDNPKVSIVIPAYNEEKLLPQTLESLSNQKFNYPFEIIVVDNASTDNTGQIASSWGVKVIHEKKKGITYARQKGLLESKGEIIISTDADTIFEKDWFNNLVKPFFKNKWINITYGPSVYPTSSKFKVKLFQTIYNGLKFFFQAIPTMVAGHNMAFRKARAMEVGGYKTKFTHGEDVEIAWRMWGWKFFSSIYVRNAKVITSARRISRESLLKRMYLVVQDSITYITQSKMTNEYEDIRE
jgi:glycosyltransferase involved in cell wall biosynthesis